MKMLLERKSILARDLALLDFWDVTLDIPMARCMSRAKFVKGCIFLMDA